MATGVPGWPELACCTASIARVRMVVMALNSGLLFHSAIGMASVPTGIPFQDDSLPLAAFQRDAKPQAVAVGFRFRSDRLLNDVTQLREAPGDILPEMDAQD